MIIDIALFVGQWLYLIASLMFLYLFIRTIHSKDGVGLLFLRVLTLGTSIGSFVVFAIRYFSEHGTLDLLTARAIAVVNPIILVAMALYLNYLFHQNGRK